MDCRLAEWGGFAYCGTIQFQYSGAALEDLGHVSHREQSADGLVHLSAPRVHAGPRIACSRTRRHLPMSSDMFFSPADFQAEWRLIPNAKFRPIQTIDGHLALFGADANAISQLDKHLGELLASKS